MAVECFFVRIPARPLAPQSFYHESPRPGHGSVDIPLDNRQAERAGVVDALVPFVGDGVRLTFLYEVDELSQDFHGL